MNHSEALQTLAAEKYLLNELPSTMREEFEEHFFECQECALDLRAGAALIGQARVQLQSGTRRAGAVKQRPFLSIFSLPLAGALIAAMALVVIYQNVVTVPKLRAEVAMAEAPAALTPISLINGATRGAEMAEATATPGQPVYLNVDVPTDSRFSSYQLTFSSPDGSAAGTIDVSPDQAKNTLLIRLPAKETRSGIYTLAIDGIQANGGSKEKLTQYRFRVLNGK
jgi:hypothetical protein